ncbi:ADP-heptose--LPS heptosyltransferase [Niabella ginsenosidivorans]|uniref:ADP-heptose--LPS heptosyltransferase n=1 Tax=Niabella ginsenosidivorans TaxID=1176587 RepID=A0A1A9I2P0_9BACT|nr:glycosyltransferase family 9 protein [Niabella ginsenosidivorans]ANH81886.1 ADP-heptose--LPS heptosyltransferase [Niabella ginsenosidivorans]
MNIAIFRVLKLGDLLCTVPAFRALRNAFPRAHIILLGMTWAASFVKRFNSYIDEFMYFPGYPGLPEQDAAPSAIRDFFNRIRKKRIDLLLQMQGNGSVVNELLEQFHPALLAGFCLPGDVREQQRTFLAYPAHLHEIHRLIALLQQLSIPDAGNELEFPLTPEDFRAFEQIKSSHSLKNYLCIHPGSAAASRQWPPLHFAHIADHFAALGYTIVLTGSAEEKKLATHVSDLMHHAATNLAGETTLGSLGVLLSRAQGLITNCTGVSHMAAALKVRSVVISMDGEPYRWAPLNVQLHYTIDWTTTADYSAVVAEAERLFSASSSL